MRKFIAITIIIVIIMITSIFVFAVAPIVKTGNFKRPLSTAVTITGEVISDNGSPITERGFIYSLSSDVIKTGTKVIVLGSIGSYSHFLTNLNPQSTYHYVAYAVNSDGITYGQTDNFKTKRDTIPPTIVDSILSINNTYIDVYMNEPVYAINKTALTINHFRWIFSSNGGPATASITNITTTNGSPIQGGESTIRFWLSVTGIPSGVETIQIWPYNGSSVYDVANQAMANTQTTGPKTLNDKLAPKISSATLSPTNSYMDIKITSGVYGPLQTPITKDLFKLSFTQNDGSATNVAITGVSNTNGNPLIGGETVIRVLLSVTGTPSGEEIISIGVVSNTSICDINGNYMHSDQTTGPKHLNDLLLPAIAEGILSTDNDYVDIIFTSRVFNSLESALSPSDFNLVFHQNNGSASSVQIASLKTLDGKPLVGGESSIRVYINVLDTPAGVETIEIMPANANSIFDINLNAMDESQTTGILTLHQKATLKSLTHSIKTANGKTAGSQEELFITGDIVALAVKLDILANINNPIITVNLNGDNPNFYLKENLTPTGEIDKSHIFAYKNGLKLPDNLVNITKENVNNTLKILTTENFITYDVLEIVYHTRLSLKSPELAGLNIPAYNVAANFTCFATWDYYNGYYSIANPGSFGLDQFQASIIISDSNIFE